MRYAPLTLALFAAVLSVSVRNAAADHDGCRIVAEGPFFYAGLVFPATKVECDSVKRRINLRGADTRRHRGSARLAHMPWEERLPPGHRRAGRRSAR